MDLQKDMVVMLLSLLEGKNLKLSITVTNDKISVSMFYHISILYLNTSLNVRYPLR